MDKSLQVALADFINELSSNNSYAFPEVIQELLRYQITITILKISIFAMIVMSSVGVFVYIWKTIRTKKKSLLLTWLFSEAQWQLSGFGFVASLLAGLYGTVFSFWLVSEVLTLINLVMAPRIFLIEYAARLIH